MRAKRNIGTLCILLLLWVMSACGLQEASRGESEDAIPPPASAPKVDRLNRLHLFPLEPFQQKIPQEYKKAFPLLKKAAEEMNTIFWIQAYGDKEELFSEYRDAGLQKLMELNYGPYDRMDNNKALIAGIPPKPAGANFYPRNMSNADLDQLPEAYDKLTLIRRDENRNLVTIPYSEAFKEPLGVAAKALREAATRVKEKDFKTFLKERALSLETDHYEYSDVLWLDQWNQELDILIGPIESYEDALNGIKSAYQACIVLKDKAASNSVAEWVKLLPGLDMDLSRELRYEKDRLPESSSVGVYDALYFSGLFNAGSKSMGLNAPHFTLPAEVDQRGKRRLILKNIVEAKYKYITLPIAERLLNKEQVSMLSEEAFFQYVLFHELSHGWELPAFERKNKNQSIQENLLEFASLLEEGKGDILGLYMIIQAYKQGLIKDGNLEQHFITSLVNTLRAIRFGRNSDHAVANVIRFNFFMEKGAYYFDESSQRFGVNPDLVESTTRELVNKILDIQAEGVANKAMLLRQEYGNLLFKYEKILDLHQDIPVDLRFE
ncbi:MAG: hypothetical protein AAGD28_12765 [Bacteroidota bacterium]